MKLLIVDDEIFIRQSMVGYFRQSDFGFDEILCAGDGQQGLGIVEQSKPEIIISDVVMPGMSGLEFVQQAKEINPECEALMISGHEETAYIRQALKFEAVDYLLKPINIDELDRVIRKIVDRVQARLSEKQAWEDMTARIRDSRELWASKLFEVLSTHGHSDEDEVRQQMQFIGCRLCADRPVVALYMGVDEYMEDMDFRDRQLVKLMLLSTVEREIAARNLKALVALHDANLLGIIANVEQDGQEMAEVIALAKAVQQEINERLHRTVAIGVGSRAPNVFMADESCRGARAALIEASLGGKNRLVAASQLSADVQQFSPISDALQWMQGLFDNANVALLRKLISENYADWLKEKASALQRELNERKAATTSRIVEMAMDIINKRYREPINLQTAADEIGITPNYLSAIFKDMVGENFTIILTRKRLEVAIEMLEKSEESIAHIAEITGFGDCNYFGKVFKKAYLLSPGAYRKRIQP